MITSQEILAKLDKKALQEDAWKKVDTVSRQLEQMAQAKDALAQELSIAQQQVALAQKAAAAAFQQELEQMAQAKDALAQELSTAQQQVALAQKAAAAAFQQGLDLDAQPKQHNAQRLSIAALSVQCCAANAGMLNTTISALLALPGCFTVQFHYLFTDTLHELSTLDGFNYASLQSMLHVLLAVEPSMLPT